MFIKQPFDEFLELQYERIDDHNIKVILPVKPLYLNSLGVVHGGIISSLADVAMSNVYSKGNATGIQQLVTIDLKTSFLSPAKGENLVATAFYSKQGKTIIHGECQIWNDKEKLVAKSNGIFYLLD
jgi:uncharacterized protein (TIGR00369 family)